MTSTVERQASDFTKHLTNIHRIAGSVSSTAYTLADAGIAPGQYAFFVADGAKFYVRWGTSAGVAVSPTAVSSGTPPSITPSATAPHMVIPSGQQQRERVPPTATHFAIVADAAAGYVTFGEATGEG